MLEEIITLVDFTTINSFLFYYSPFLKCALFFLFITEVFLDNKGNTEQYIYKKSTKIFGYYTLFSIILGYIFTLY